MEFKKCDRCGNFFNSNDVVCGNCLVKERFEISKFKNYISDNNIESISSLNNIAIETGISQKNLNRFLSYDDFSGIQINQL